MRVKLKDICTVITDGSHSSPIGIEKGYPMLSVKDMRSMGFDYSDCKFISKKDYDILARNGCKPQINDVLIAKDGSYLKEVFVIKEDVDQVILSSIAILRPDITKINPYFLMFYLQTESVKEIVANKYVSGSALQRIILKNFKEIEIDLPDRPTQDKIVEILSNIDNQIKRNNEMTKRLQVLGNTIYSKNIKETSNFLVIDESKIKTGKQDANFATPNGRYKFFTCSEDSFLCDSYEFDGKNILIAGNGNFNVKFYDGKFNAYQRTYVISDNDIYGNLYYTYSYNTQSLLKGANGSIVKFITIGMLKDIQIPEFSKEVNDILNNIVYEINNIKQEIDNLNQLKIKLLPLLINGQTNI